MAELQVIRVIIMASPQAELLRSTLWQLRNSAEGAKLPSVEEMRSLNALMESLGSEPSEVHFKGIDVEGIPAMWVEPEIALDDRILLYLHGGGCVFGSIQSHRKLVGHLAKSIGCRALNLDYRLAPEHSFPAAVEDATKAYIWLLDQGIESHHIALAGDSVGGGLCLACILDLLSKDYPLPSAVVMMSPWVDLALTGDSIDAFASVDPINARPFIQLCADLYLAGKDARSPLASPLYARFEHLPPMYIQVGEYEILRDDAIRLADKAKVAGNEVRLDVFPEMFHLFQLAVGNMPEADDAIERISRWLKGRLKIVI
jgi:monoterpene epsilon-lactone hydrolase